MLSVSRSLSLGILRLGFFTHALAKLKLRFDVARSFRMTVLLPRTRRHIFFDELHPVVAPPGIRTAGRHKGTRHNGTSRHNARHNGTLPLAWV